MYYLDVQSKNYSQIRKNKEVNFKFAQLSMDNTVTCTGKEARFKTIQNMMVSAY